MSINYFCCIKIVYCIKLLCKYSFYREHSKEKNTKFNLFNYLQVHKYTLFMTAIITRLESFKTMYKKKNIIFINIYMGTFALS